MGKRKDGQQSGGGNKKRKYHHQETAGKGPALPHGKQGILISICTSDPVRGGKEALNVLSDVLDGLEKSAGSAAQPAAAKAPAQAAAAEAPAASKSADAAATAAPQAGDAPADFSSLLAEEVTDLKDESKKRLRLHDTGIKTLLFLEMPFATRELGPCQVVQRLMENAEKDRLLQFRHCARFLPCTHICKADKEAIASTAKEMVAERLDCSESATPQSVAVLYEHRASSQGLDRNEVIDAAIESVPRPPHTVKLKGAAKTISVQVVRNSCGMAIVDDYHRFGKYNIRTVCEGVAEAGDNPAKSSKTAEKPAEEAEPAKPS